MQALHICTVTHVADMHVRRHTGVAGGQLSFVKMTLISAKFHSPLPCEEHVSHHTPTVCSVQPDTQKRWPQHGPADRLSERSLSRPTTTVALLIQGDTDPGRLPV